MKILVIVVALIACVSTAAMADTEGDIYEYIDGINSEYSDLATGQIMRAAQEHGLDPWLLVSIARFESTFNPFDIGGAGERGLIQIHPCHRDNFEAAGCDWDDPTRYDHIRFGGMMIRTSLDNGATLHQALRPWAVRSRALRLYYSFPDATGTGMS